LCCFLNFFIFNYYFLIMCLICRAKKNKNENKNKNSPRAKKNKNENKNKNKPIRARLFKLFTDLMLGSSYIVNQLIYLHCN
jgi:hypothetical protein